MNQVKFQQKCWDLTDVLPAHSGSEYEAELKKLMSDVE